MTVAIAAQRSPSWMRLPLDKRRCPGTSPATRNVAAARRQHSCNVDREEQGRTAGEAELAELQHQPDNRERWHQRNGDGCPRQRIRGLLADVGVCAGRSCCTGDAEVEQVRRRASQHLGRQRIELAASKDPDAGGKTNRSDGAGADDAHARPHASRPPHHDGSRRGEHGAHQRSDEHRSDHDGGRVCHEPEHGNRYGERHQCGEAADVPSPARAFVEEAGDDGPTFLGLERDPLGVATTEAAEQSTPPAGFDV